MIDLSVCGAEVGGGRNFRENGHTHIHNYLYRKWEEWCSLLGRALEWVRRMTRVCVKCLTNRVSRWPAYEGPLFI